MIVNAFRININAYGITCESNAMKEDMKIISQIYKVNFKIKTLRKMYICAVLSKAGLVLLLKDIKEA